MLIKLNLTGFNALFSLNFGLKKIGDNAIVEQLCFFLK